MAITQTHNLFIMNEWTNEIHHHHRQDEINNGQQQEDFSKMRNGDKKNWIYEKKDDFIACKKN